VGAVDARCQASARTQVGEAVVGLELERDEAAAGSGTTAEATPAAAADADPLADARVYTGRTRLLDDTKTEFKIEVGKLVRAQDGLMGEFAELPAVCEADPQRAALIPVRLSVTNNTVEFASRIATGLILSLAPYSYDATGIRTQIAASFSDGPRCNDGNGNLVSNVEFSDVDTGDTRTQDYVVVMHNYYSPKNPDGTPDVIAKTVAALLKGDAIVECFAGPGADEDGSFPLSEEVAGDKPGVC
jgi:hypothetical protein